MVQYDKTPDSKFVVDYRTADAIWDMIDSAEYLNWGPDPPLLLVAETNYSVKKSSDSNHEFLFSRLPDGSYDRDDNWEHIRARFNMDGKKAYCSHFFDNPDEADIKSTQITSQIYTSSGAMLTFDLNQDLGEEAHAFIRIPVHPSYAEEAKMGTWPDGFEYFHYQYRNFSGKWGNPPSGYDEYFHPHYSSKTITEVEDVVEMFRRLFEIVEKSERRWGGI